MMPANTEGVRAQFSMRVPTFNTAANWMLDENLLAAHLRAAGDPAAGYARALDLCCGTGIVGRALQRVGFNVSGIDLTPEMAEEADRYFPSVAGSVDAMPFADGAFDLAVLRQSYMLLDAKKSLAEIRRVLRPGGTFVLSQSVPFSGADEPRYREVQLARHLHIIKYDTAESLLRELNDHGFTVKSVTFLRVRESTDRWLRCAPELTPELRARIRELIRGAPESYRAARHVTEESGELFEDWNWAVFQATLGSANLGA